MIWALNTDNNVFVRNQQQKNVFQRLNAQSKNARNFFFTIGDLNKKGDTEFTLISDNDIRRRQGVFIGDDPNLDSYSLYVAAQKTKKFQKILICPFAVVRDPWGETDESRCGPKVGSAGSWGEQ